MKLRRLHFGTALILVIVATALLRAFLPVQGDSEESSGAVRKSPVPRVATSTLVPKVTSTPGPVVTIAPETSLSGGIVIDDLPEIDPDDARKPSTWLAESRSYGSLSGEGQGVRRVWMYERNVRGYIPKKYPLNDCTASLEYRAIHEETHELLKAVTGDDYFYHLALIPMVDRENTAFATRGNTRILAAFTEAHSLEWKQDLLSRMTSELGIPASRIELTFPPEMAEGDEKALGVVYRP